MGINESGFRLYVESPALWLELYRAWIRLALIVHPRLLPPPAAKSRVAAANGGIIWAAARFARKASSRPCTRRAAPPAPAIPLARGRGQGRPSGRD